MRNANERVFGVAPGLQLTDSECVENADSNVQAMRDQGIADACNGYPAFAWFYGDQLWVCARDGLSNELDPIGPETIEWREAFAYAQAYEANDPSR